MASNGGMRTLVVILAVAAALGGCTNTETPSAGTTPPTPTTTDATSTPSTTTGTTTSGVRPTLTTPTVPSLSPSGIPAPPGGNQVTLEGVVQAGVEAGCLLLNSQGAQYLLLGGDQSVLREGRRVIVRGQAQPGVATTCQQGVPFIVAEARPG
jgi:hypothetical protein